MKLTETRIKNTKKDGSKIRLADGGGLYLLITPQGGRLWRWKYRFEGKEKLMSFGTYPEVSLASAREKHSVARKLLAERIDPMAERKAEKQADQVAAEHSFAAITKNWLKHWEHGKSTRHVDSTRRRLETNVLPSLGALSIAEIEAPEIVAMIRGIEARGAGDIAKRALETTGQIFRYAIAHGYTKRNPSAEIKPGDILKSTRKVNYARIDAKELPNLLQKIEVYPGTHVTRLAIRLMALTFVRTSELIGGKWEEIDFDAKRWNIPEERMKMRTPHIVPLSAQALDVLAYLQRINTAQHKAESISLSAERQAATAQNSAKSPFLFPGERSPQRSISNNTILKGLERMGFKGRMTGHGFRGLASTILHEQGYEHEHIELQLAHSPRNAVSAAYNHALYLKPRAKMMQEWADFLDSQQRTAKVIEGNFKRA